MFRKIAHRHLQSALRMMLIQPNESRFVPATRAPAKQAGKHQVDAAIVFCQNMQSEKSSWQTLFRVQAEKTDELLPH